MAKERFERRKPVLNVETIGLVDQGKTSLTARTKVGNPSTFFSYSVDCPQDNVTNNESKIPKPTTPPQLT